MRRRSAIGAGMVVLVCAGCLKDNPAFIGTGGGSGDSSGDELGAETASGGSCESDGFEDNDDESQTAEIGTVMMDGAHEWNAVAAPGDDDWFTVRINARDGYPDDLPDETTAVVTVDSAEVELCAYLNCFMGQGVGSHACTEGSAAPLSPQGRVGCCGTSSIEFDHTCNRWQQDVDALVRVRASSQCTHYSVAITGQAI